MTTISNSLVYILPTTMIYKERNRRKEKTCTSTYTIVVLTYRPSIQNEYTYDYSTIEQSIKGWLFGRKNKRFHQIFKHSRENYHDLFIVFFSLIFIPNGPKQESLCIYINFFFLFVYFLIQTETDRRLTLYNIELLLIFLNSGLHGWFITIGAFDSLTFIIDSYAAVTFTVHFHQTCN